MKKKIILKINSCKESVQRMGHGKQSSIFGACNIGNTSESNNAQNNVKMAMSTCMELFFMRGPKGDK